MFDQIHVTNAANDGARVGAVKGGTDAAAKTAASSSAGSLIGCALATPTATHSGGSPDQLTVTVNCSYSTITPLGNLISGVVLPATLTGTAMMRVEQ
jgi:hypothetical protein